jgi:hypothetical protein
MLLYDPKYLTTSIISLDSPNTLHRRRKAPSRIRARTRQFAGTPSATATSGATEALIKERAFCPRD